MKDMMKGANIGFGLVFGVLSAFAVIDTAVKAIKYGLTFI